MTFELELDLDDGRLIVGSGRFIMTGNHTRYREEVEIEWDIEPHDIETGDSFDEDNEQVIPWLEEQYDVKVMR